MLTRKQTSTNELVDACETYIRVLEVRMAGDGSEHLVSGCSRDVAAQLVLTCRPQRKVRRLLLVCLKEIKQYETGLPLSPSETELRNHILGLYRWNADGRGLGV
jgi:hypothetical protein